MYTKYHQFNYNKKYVRFLKKKNIDYKTKAFIGIIYIKKDLLVTKQLDIVGLVKSPLKCRFFVFSK